MIDGWSASDVDQGALVKMLASWRDVNGNAVSLYADGVVEVLGECPVELLPYVQAVWHLNQQQRQAY